ncbi:Alkaline protease secretion ATP-binding protein AprD [Azospirillaceae bacterium]
MEFRPDNNIMHTVMASCASYFVSACVFSIAINILYLAPTIYMMQVSDRVLPSGSKETLLLLTLAYVLSMSTLVALDIVRSMVLTRAGLRIDRMLSVRLMSILMERANQQKNSSQKRDDALRSLDRFRQFITGTGVHAVFDVPWMPIYMGILFLVHPMLGYVALMFMGVQVFITVLTDKITQRRLMLSGMAYQKSAQLADAALRNAEVVIGMGMIESILGPWYEFRRTMLAHQVVASDRNAILTCISKGLRFLVQSLMVALGTYLAIDHLITAGAMFASMLLIGRATQPLDQILGVWKYLIDARAAYRNLNEILLERPFRQTSAVLPRPTGIVHVDRVFYAPPQSTKAILSGLNFTMEPGSCYGLIGPTASGKSTLARLMVGVHAANQGVVRLDGADVYTWERRDFGRYVGYLPQDVELFAGSVAQNISRFLDEENFENLSEAIIEASTKAGAHDMILRLPKGYETAIGEQGAILSGGQRQQIGLARAVFGKPCFVVLDEPNSNLDSDGEIALGRCLQHLKVSKTSVVIISHRPGILNFVDRVVYLDGGQIRNIMERDEFFAKMGKPNTSVATR